MNVVKINSCKSLIGSLSVKELLNFSNVFLRRDVNYVKQCCIRDLTLVMKISSKFVSFKNEEKNLLLRSLDCDTGFEAFK